MGIKVTLNIAASYILPGRTLSSTGHIWSCASHGIVIGGHFQEETKSKSSSQNLLIMVRCGGDGRWRMSEENGAGRTPFVEHAVMWIQGIMMLEKRRHCITLCIEQCDFTGEPTTNEAGMIVQRRKTEDCGVLLLMMLNKRDRKHVGWGF